MTMTFGYAPNKTRVTDTQNDTAWNVIATDGSGYTTLALLAAASKVPWPNLDSPAQLAEVELREDNGAGISGSGFFFVFNSATQPSSDTQGMFVSGGGYESDTPGRVTNLWIKKNVGTDRVFVRGGY